MASKYRLLIEKLRELSMVGRPANAGSLVLFHKSDDVPAPRSKAFRAWLKKALGQGDLTPDAVVRKAEEFATRREAPVDDVLKDYSDEELEKEMRRRKAAASDDDGESDDDEEQDTEYDDAEEGSGKRQKKGAKKMSKADRDVIEKQAEELAELRDKIAKADEREQDRTLLVVAKTMQGEIGAADAAKLVPILKKCTAEERTFLGEILKAANALQKASHAFDVLGSESTLSLSALEELEKKADEIQKADPKLSNAQAMARAADANPDLYLAVASAADKR